MKRLLFCIITLVQANAFAQESKQVETLLLPKERRQEFGVFMQVGDGNNSENVSLLGLQYKRFKNEHLGYRLIVAYGAYSDFEGSKQFKLVPDTFTEKTTHTRADLIMLGAGLEAQRHFYKNISLFAALEFRSGYGSGIVDTSIEKTYEDLNGYSKTYGLVSTSEKVSILHSSFTPSIGAKAQFRKLAIGVELFPISFAFNYKKYDKYDLSGINFSMPEFSTRLFVHYRF